MIFRLVPAIEFEPSLFAIKQRDSPLKSWDKLSEEWLIYWQECLSDRGILNFKAIGNSWLVALRDLFDKKNILNIFLNLLFQERFYSDDDDENEIFLKDLESYFCLAGEYVVFKDEIPIIYPQCCWDLSDLSEWEKAAKSNTDEWKSLWIGHPWLLYKSDGEKLIIRETSEYELIRKLRSFRIDKCDLKIAIELAKKELEKFAITLKETLTKTYSIELSQKIAQILVYRE